MLIKIILTDDILTVVSKGETVDYFLHEITDHFSADISTEIITVAKEMKVKGIKSTVFTTKEERNKL